ncbi:hypothetical protein HUT10_00580 [Amycolatopsis sp. Hca4]|nr:hypothetical protein HUT10_00580 [Amycolatopsis sp. Hca4]
MPDEETPAPDQSPSDGANSQPQDPEKRADRRVAIISVIATAALGVLGVAGTIVGSKLSVDASIRNQEFQASELRAKENREKRTDTYFNFLDAAEKYATATTALYYCRYPPTIGGQITHLHLDECTNEAKLQSLAHDALLTTGTKVYVYGSHPPNLKPT